MSNSNIKRFPLREEYDKTAEGWNWSIKTVQTDDGKLKFVWCVHVEHKIRYDLQGAAFTWLHAKQAMEKAIAKEKAVGK